MIFVNPKSVIVSLGDGFRSEFFEWLKEKEIQWRPDPTISFLENLYEFAGRLCYESWTLEDGSFVNKNLTKIRSGNFKYLENILLSGHGSVLEHGSIVILFNDVSRVFTHELVRHRAGTAMSQTSGRYVRSDNIRFWIPGMLTNHKNGKEIENIITGLILSTEHDVRKITQLLELDDPGLSFSIKKKLTSALRRITPNGIANNILFSFNGRSLRHTLNMRCDEAAEEEMHYVMRPLSVRLKILLPSLLQDFNIDTFKFEINSKV